MQLKIQIFFPFIKKKAKKSPAATEAMEENHSSEESLAGNRIRSHTQKPEGTL